MDLVQGGGGGARLGAGGAVSVDLASLSLSPALLPAAADGAKSTNQLWNSARAIASSVAFIRWFNSIFVVQRPQPRRDGFLIGEGWQVELERFDSDSHPSGVSLCRRH